AGKQRQVVHESVLAAAAMVPVVSEAHDGERGASSGFVLPAPHLEQYFVGTGFEQRARCERGRGARIAQWRTEERWIERRRKPDACGGGACVDGEPGAEAA